MTYTVTHAHVQDFAAFQQSFAAGQALRKARGSRGARIFQNPSDPKDIIVLLEWEDLEGAQQHFQSTELREGQQQGGVLGRPDPYEETASFPA
jgi:heme-degrading monooxygenase HmoA